MNDKIIQLNVTSILENATIDEEREIIVTKEDAYNRAKKDKTKGKVIFSNDYGSLLFDQMRKALWKNGDFETQLSSIFFILDFSGCKDKYYTFLSLAKNGIELTIDGKKITIIEFFKSNSMSRESKIYYINKDYFDLINERITFGLCDKNNKIDLSKWYAYTGLAITDCHLINSIHFNSDEVVVVDDLEKIIKTDCFTAISVPLLFTDINVLIDQLKDKESIEITSFKMQNIYEKFNCYKKSKDFNNLSNELQTIINVVLDNNKSVKEYINELKKVLEDYKTFDSPNKNIIWEKINVTNFPVSVNYYDGEGLISLELDKEINASLLHLDNELENEDEDNNEDFKDEDYLSRTISHSFQIRLPFVKGVVHSCDLKKFFKNHNVQFIYGKTYNGNKKRKYDVTKIKMILTESQFKISKFIANIKTLENEDPIDAYFRLLNEYSYSFGISNVETYSRVDYVKLCYQFFSTMPLESFEARDLLRSNQKYLNEITNNEEIIASLKDMGSDFTPLLNIYDVNKDFVFNTQQFKNIKRNLLAKEKENSSVSKMNVEGTRKFLSSDLLGLLYYIIGENFDSDLKVNELYMPNTNYPNNNLPMALLRNPHYSRNEIKMLWPNNNYGEREEYFGHLTGVCMTNPCSLTAMRLGGADYDGDSIIITWQPLIVNKLYKSLYKNHHEIYPLVVIPSISSNKVHNTHTNRIMCFRNTFRSFVGRISDQCFVEAMKAYKEDKFEDIAFYTILNGLEIDSAKNGRKPAIPQVSDETQDKHALEFIKVKSNLKRNVRSTELLNKIKTYDGVLFDNVRSMSNYNLQKEKYNAPKIKANNKIEQNDAIELASIVNAYSNFMRAVKLYRRFEYNSSYKNIESLLRQLNEILEKNGYKLDIEDLMNEFNTDNAYETLLNYLEDKIFYINNEDKQDSALIGLGFYNTPKEYKEVIFNYENEGFKVLYLILYYIKESQSNLIFKDQYFNKNLRKLNLRKINKNYEKLIINKSNYMIEDIKEIIDDFTKDTKLDFALLNEIKAKVLLYFKNKVSKYSINDLAFVCNIYNTNITQDLFEEKVINELLKMRKETL